MKNGHSYNTVTDKDNPNHPLIKALVSCGLEDITLIYASHLSSESGWTILESNYWIGWIGFTKEDSLSFIEKNIKPYCEKNIKGKK
jgi:hypothetical protein